ncbi:MULTISPECIES: hypothetical protein [unclassified Paenibacillus]|nr:MULTISPECIES: hypothetical protein [unclassified Paenibacillus]MDF9844559.1 hypothetical protein [Paenibacillus sp. PastF-2]MDF9851156.1 hypothetical protein [Paenibacillus sp. PastM-2]MDF9856209.1 hypothetical protein [Paenibacillus sp. PastF-1]MDH6481562.1 hypothetical protein [Paenibacillus sp. PastH-2]MDH6510424.1 hypothetical protein [Paenibacillus sp. PastM-3]
MSLASASGGVLSGEFGKCVGRSAERVRILDEYVEAVGDKVRV